MRVLTVLALVTFALFAGRAAAADEFPKGTFLIKGPDGGEWMVTFDGKGKFVAKHNGDVGVKGSYKVTKDEIKFTDEEGPFAGQGEDKTYTYKWKQDGKKLTFTKVKDSNDGRVSVITNAAWEKKDD